MDTQEKSKELTPITRDEKGRFIKGVSANPLGRPRNSFSINDRIRQIFSEDPEGFDLFVRAYMRDPNNWKHIHDHLDGKPNQSINQSGESNLPFIIEVREHDGGDTNTKD